MKRRVAGACFCFLPLFAEGAPFATPDLPLEEQVIAVLRGSPAVSASEENVEAQAARARRLAAGNHEWSLKVGQHSRRVRATPDERYAEWDVGLERSLRLPGKQELDVKLGDAGVALARIGRGEVLHEAGRGLLAGWFEWLRERASANQWQQQRESLARQARVVTRRVELGDAPRLERLQSDAALAQASAQLVQAEGRARIAAQGLRLTYPGLSLPENVPEIAPAPLEGGPQHWVAVLVEHSHELRLARAESLRARIGAGRSTAERRPDPSIGVRMARERGGEERLLGVSLSIPLPGEGRRADSDAALADARASAHREAGVRRRIEAGATALYERALAARDGWRRQQEAAEALESSAHLVERAWQLGEGSLAETLAARRLAHEAKLAAQIARLEASEARYRLLLDAHQLWALDTETDAEDSAQ